MAKQNPKAEAVKKIILENVNLVENGQDNLLIAKIEKQVGYKFKSDNKRAFLQQKDKVLAEHRARTKAQAAEVKINKDGKQRKEITEHGGRKSRAAHAREFIKEFIDGEISLAEAADKLTVVIIDDLTNKGTYDESKPHSFYRLQARNEIERLTPKEQEKHGVEVMTKQEIKMATRTRDWKRQRDL